VVVTEDVVCDKPDIIPIAPRTAPDYYDDENNSFEVVCK
jgi:hypothetical protein